MPGICMSASNLAGARLLEPLRRALMGLHLRHNSVPINLNVVGPLPNIQGRPVAPVLAEQLFAV
jgi:hypothetical protein